jgi:hypothetical protein
MIKSRSSAQTEPPYEILTEWVIAFLLVLLCCWDHAFGITLIFCVYFLPILVYHYLFRVTPDMPPQKKKRIVLLATLVKLVYIWIVAGSVWPGLVVMGEPALLGRLFEPVPYEVAQAPDGERFQVHRYDTPIDAVFDLTVVKPIKWIIIFALPLGFSLSVFVTFIQTYFDRKNTTRVLSVIVCLVPWLTFLVWREHVDDVIGFLVVLAGLVTYLFATSLLSDK